MWCDRVDEDDVMVCKAQLARILVAEANSINVGYLDDAAKEKGKRGI